MDRTSHRQSHSGARAVAVIVVTMVALLASALPAVAAIYERDLNYQSEDAFGYDDCGFHVDVAGTYSGSFQTRTGTGPDASAFFVHNRFVFDEVHTRTSDGSVIIVSGHGLFQEVKATQIDGSVFEFTAIQAGQPFVVTDADGHLLVRDRGTIRETILFDTFGNDTPGGEFIEQLDFSIAGPHPGFDVDFCALFG
jgi:hypothetical protein